MRASYDLLKLPSRAMRTRALMSKGTELEARTLALSVAIMAQVRMAHANFMDAKRNFDYRDKSWKLYRQQLDLARKTFQSGSAVSRFDLDRMELETTEQYLRRVQALGDWYMAYYRLINAVGMPAIDAAAVTKTLAASAATTTAVAAQPATSTPRKTELPR
jgi:hypothetical protein